MTKRSRTFPGGLTIIYYGTGKGKTTAAIGVAVRAAGAGLRVLVLQFIKGEWPSAEGKALARLPSVRVKSLGKGFVKILGDRKPLAVHKQVARNALREAKRQITTGKHDLVILDEAISAVEEGLLSVTDLAKLIDSKPKKLHLILTGHRAYPTLIRRADLVSEMKEIKHPFRKGYIAVEGIDY